MFSFITACNCGKVENCKKRNCHAKYCALINQKLTSVYQKVPFCVYSDPYLQQLMLWQATKNHCHLCRCVTAVAVHCSALLSSVLLCFCYSVIVPSTIPRQSQPPVAAHCKVRPVNDSHFSFATFLLFLCFVLLRMLLLLLLLLLLCFANSWQMRARN